MPTLAGLRRRGYTPEALKLFCERSGVTKSGGWIDYASLEAALRDTLDPIAPRAMAVLDPVKLVITNWGELMGGDDVLDDCSAPVHPHHPEMGRRHFKLGREVWIERTDYEDVQPKGFFRLFPGNKVRLKYGHVIECTGATRDADGKLVEVQATLVPDTKSGTPGADAIKVKGNITWVAAADAVQAEVRLYERLFAAAQPGQRRIAGRTEQGQPGDAARPTSNLRWRSAEARRRLPVRAARLLRARRQGGRAMASGCSTARPACGTAGASSAHRMQARRLRMRRA